MTTDEILRRLTTQTDAIRVTKTAKGWEAFMRRPGSQAYKTGFGLTADAALREAIAPPYGVSYDEWLGPDDYDPEAESLI